MNGSETNGSALAIAITAALVALLPLLTSWWVRNRARQIRPEDVGSQSAAHHPSWRSFALAFYLYVIGCVPVFIIFSSNRDVAIIAFFSVFTLLAWALATYRVWMLRRTRITVGSDVIRYETERGRVEIPRDAISRVFISAGHIVIEKTDATRVAIPMIFARNAVLYAQLVQATGKDPIGGA